MGGGYFTRSVVTFNDEVLGKPCLFVQEALGGIFVSNREATTLPPLEVGHSVDIGGNLELRKYSPAIRPLSLNILGRQNLPVPARPSAAKDYRDGLWTEMDGVVRVVQADGTLLLAGKHTTIPVWVGRTERKALEELVDSTLCVRGVMSLEAWEHPLVLVPSRSFVEIKEAAPGIPDRPSAIAGLNSLVSRTGWTHRVKVEGAVTYRDHHGFFLQDSSEAVRVLVRDGSPPAVGESVTVVGFADVEGAEIRISEPTWQPGGLVPEAVPVRVGQSGAIRQGELVTVEARLLSRAHRDGDLVLELQAGQQILEAVLVAAATTDADFETGSLLGLTGVGLVTSGARPQVLLRTVRDVVLLEGSPWWTWQRAAMLIGLLVVVLAGTLLRLRFLHRRFERQQTARLAFSRGMLESQESERRRIAASLHDSLGQELLVIRNQAHFALQASSDDPALRRRLEEISETTLQAINEVREITRNLRPYQLDRLGLSQSIRALARKVSENSSIEFACHVDEVDDLFDDESEIHLYRIVQEALNNVLKHSGATEAAVVVKKVPGSLSISIRDNGRGLSAPATAGSSGFGLSGIKERAEIMGGAARLDSSPGQGVNLLVLLPLPTLHAKPDQSPDR